MGERSLHTREVAGSKPAAPIVWTPRRGHAIGVPRGAKGRRDAQQRRGGVRSCRSLTGAYEGLITYDAKDPDTSFPAIEPLRPPAGAPNVLVVLLDDVGFGASSAFGGPCATPTAERLAAGGLKYNRFHTTALCSPTRAGAADGPQPSRGRDGRDHRDRDLGAGLQLGAARTRPRRWRRRSSSTATRRRSSASATRCRCGRRARWGRSMRGRPAAAGSSTSTGSSAPRRTSGRRRCIATRCRSSPTGRRTEGYHFTEDLTDKAIEWVEPAEGADARQAVLRVLRARARRTRRTTSRRSGRTSTAASSTTAGTRCASARSPARRSSG